MTNLIEDVSSLTEVTETTLSKLVNVANYCVGHAVYESNCRKQDTTTVDIGIGELTIRVSATGIHYRFVPSSALEKCVAQTVVTKTSPMVVQLEQRLQDKIDRSYKELI